MMDIHTYWEGPVPPLVQRCLDRTARFYGDRFRLVRQWPAEFGAAPKCAVHFRSDLWKWEVLHRRGGIVLDADCVLTRDLTPLCDRPLTVFRDRSGLIDVGCIAAREPDNPLIDFCRQTAWLKYRLGLLDSWTALGKGVTVAAPFPETLSNTSIMPIHWRDNAREQFHHVASPEEHAARFDRDAYCYMLTRGVTQPPPPGGSFLAWLLDQPVRRD